MATDPESSFDKAIDVFRSKSGLSNREIMDMKMTTLADLQKTLAAVQQRQQNSKTMKFLRRLQPFLDSMEQYSKAVNIFANASDIVAFIWGPMRFILIIASNFAEAFNALLEGYLMIGESIPQLAQYQDLFGANPYMRHSLAAIFEDIMDFHLEAVKLFRQKSAVLGLHLTRKKTLMIGLAWRQLYHATWRGLNNRIEYLTKSLRRHKEAVETQASLNAYQQFQDFRMSMKAEFARIEQSEKDHQLTRVQHWLGAINSNLRHEHTARLRFPGTGQWLLRDQRFQNWFSPDQCVDPLLWLHGIPGAGKTILASLIIDEARKIPGANAICYYCKQIDRQRNGIMNVAKSLLSQISSTNVSLLPYLYEETLKSGEAVLSSNVTAKTLLKTALQSCKRVYIILDGLDEYIREDRKELSSWFQELVSSLLKADLGSIRCLFVSQEDGYARKDFSMLSQIKITPNDNKADISAFCEEWHQKIESKFGFLEGMHHVKNVVSARAQGMFLFARLVTCNLFEQASRHDFETEIDPNRLPDGLDQAYERIMDRLLGPNAGPQLRTNNIRMLLGWLVCAKRPLKWYEIQGAIAVDLESGSLSPKRQFQEDGKDLCASLVEINPDQSVTLVHSTAKGYLVRNEFIEVADSEFDMAVRCTVYLSMPEFEVSVLDRDIENAILRDAYAFAEYAVCFWAYHLESGVQDLDEQKLDQSQFISECLETFLDAQWVSRDKAYSISNTLNEHLGILSHHMYYDKICQAVAAAKSWLRPTWRGPADNDILALSHTIGRLRTVHERLVSSASLTKETKDLILQYYGPNHYKCPRLNCQFFQQGFATKAQREQHTSKHERSFTCLEYGCPYSVIGFTTMKDLEEHSFNSHGIQADPADGKHEFEFPEKLSTQSALGPPTSPPPPPPLRPTKNKPRITFPCTACHKTFTRVYNLSSHMRSHNGVRPFVCGVCGKAFVRQHDRKRHEDSHSSEKNFVCKGELKFPPNAQWGCGKRFGRADALSLHYRSEAGRKCIKPLLEEQAREQCEQGAISSNSVREPLASLADMHSTALQDNEQYTQEKPVNSSSGIAEDDCFQVPRVFESNANEAASLPQAGEGFQSAKSHDPTLPDFGSSHAPNLTEDGAEQLLFGFGTNITN